MRIAALLSIALFQTREPPTSRFMIREVLWLTALAAEQREPSAHSKAVGRSATK
jgi:hypothetical protein